MSESKISAQKDYYNLDKPEDFIFSKQAVQEMVLYEKTIELIGIVDTGEIKPNLLKFTLINKDDDIIQVLVWDNDKINEIKAYIMSGNIIHIDGAFARPRNPSMNKGNIQFDLTIMSNTLVRLIKSLPEFKNVSNTTNSIKTSIQNSMKHSSVIEVTGYIKNVIKETNIPNGKINQGCLSDCENYKLEVRMPITCDMSEFSVGAHVKVTGIIKHAQCPYLWVQNKCDVSFESKEKKSIKQLLQGNKILKRILNDSSNADNKKLKQ